MKKVYETTMRKLVVMMLIAVMALTFTGCGSDEVEDTATEETATEEVTTEETTEEESTEDVLVVDKEFVAIGEGETFFYFTVQFEYGTENLYEVNSDATTVGEALLELELIAGEDSDYGLYVTTVDGVTLDWDTDAAYWGFYIDGEMAMTGVDSTELVAGSLYTLAYAQ